VTSPHYASAAPIHERGLHSRAGNAMARTRAAVLDGASRAVEKHGARKATMADIASLAGIAKGTLYNHFRAKEAVYGAALDAGIRTIAAECVAAAHDDLADALSLAAERLGSHPALRRIAADEPAVLAALMTPTDMPVWVLARSAVRDVLVAAGVATSAASIDLIVRWLTSFIASTSPSASDQAGLIAAALVPPAVRAEVAAGAGPDWQAGHQ
jgi:AcrR family transcriptional regulator